MHQIELKLIFNCVYYIYIKLGDWIVSVEPETGQIRVSSGLSFSENKTPRTCTEIILVQNFFSADLVSGTSLKIIVKNLHKRTAPQPRNQKDITKSDLFGLWSRSVVFPGLNLPKKVLDLKGKFF